MRRFFPRLASLSLLAVVVAASAGPGCDREDPQNDDYYARKIQPILDASCSGNTSGCHRADPADPFQQAAGNLDTTSYENVLKRRDLLRTYGAYPVPMLLIKAVGATDELQIAYNDAFLPIEIEHAGGGILTVGSPAFVELQRWLQNGATRTGVRPAAQPVAGQGNCSTTLPSDFDPMTVTSTMEWQSAAGEFTAAMTVLSDKGCTASNCHGAPQSDFYVTCGDDEAQRAFNFRQLWSFVASSPPDSEILRRPLEPSLGGSAHTGGVHFPNTSDPGYGALLAFADKVGKLEFGEGDAGKEFFAAHVMPVFLKRGCAAEGCHSPAAMNDFKLRAGGSGHFSATALEKNYDLAKREFLAFEVPDVRRGRVVAKGILAMYGGIAHRGGPVLETPFAGGAQPSSCGPFDPMATDTPAYCVLVEWSRIEREALIAAGEIDRLDAGSTVPLVYVERAASHVASPLDFATHQGGSDLVVQDATLDADGAITGVGNRRSLAAGCAGYDAAQSDVRAPDVDHTATKVVFAMRTTSADSLNVYVVDLATGGNCSKLTNHPAGVHSFDPAWTPDGSAIVYASTAAGGTSKSGRPQSDLWRMSPNGQDPERITFLSNSELGPQFMREGRLIMSTEKGDPAGDFYQVAGRRLNWDLTDYHPLLAQRATSRFGDFPPDPMMPVDVRPSVGYAQATDIREAFDGDFVLILADAGARGGAGTLAVFNRSVGPMEAGRSGESYLESLRLPDPAASGRAGGGTGAYRSPFPLLDGRIMASYVGGAVDVTTATSMDFDIVAVDRSGQRSTIIGGPLAQVDAVLAIKYPARKLYVNRRQLVFGGYQGGDASKAEVHLTDAPMLATLLDANLRRGRPVTQFRGADRVAFIGADGTTLGEASLNADGSAKVCIDASTPVFIELREGATPLFRMTEEHQFGPGEHISLGVREELFDHVCGGCHGSISGAELDVSVIPDALTGASQSQAAASDPCNDGQ